MTVLEESAAAAAAGERLAVEAAAAARLDGVLHSRAFAAALLEVSGRCACEEARFVAAASTLWGVELSAAQQVVVWRAWFGCREHGARNRRSRRLARARAGRPAGGSGALRGAVRGMTEREARELVAVVEELRAEEAAAAAPVVGWSSFESGSWLTDEQIAALECGECQG